MVPRVNARIGALLAGLLVLGAWSAALASAHGEAFTVTYTGAGTLTSQIKSLTSPECGDVTEGRNETTHFSWVTHYDLPVLVLGRQGVDGVPAKAEAHPSSLASNESTVTLSDTGCQPGIANCKGESDPQPGHEAMFDLPSAAKRAKSRVKVGAVGGFAGFTGKGFSGGWGFQTGSCAIQFNDSQLLLPEFNVPSQLEASFPVKVSTLESLRAGHYFKVRIDPGHYAPAHKDTCFADDGCLKDDFTWHGVVEFKRTG
jgi:hypothetical protein